MFGKQFDFSLWKRSNKKRHRDWEAYRLTVFNQLWNVLTVMSEKYQWNTLVIFGSLIREGCFSPSSDIDIGVSGLNKFSHYSFVSELSSMLNHDVDVILLEECSFAQSIVSKGIIWTKNRSPSF
jgi:predicted nucleotidyltransferase